MFSNNHDWRLILDPVNTGAWNMAVDEAVLEFTGNRRVPPTLRFYAWEPACLSLGMAQPISDVDLTALEWKGWQVVRRPTGGRAILHTDEMTYSISGQSTEPCLAGGVLESYRIISQALLRALELLGIPAVAAEAPAPGPTQAAGATSEPADRIPDSVCFVEPSNYEITVGGKKLVGSAQARRANAVLQHGSLPLCGDLTRIVQVLKYTDRQAQQKAAQRVVESAITIEQVLQKIIPWKAAADAFCQAFEEKIPMKLIYGELSPEEIRRAEALEKQKYSNPGWTMRV